MISFSKTSQEHYRCVSVLNGLDPDQDRRPVGPDLDPSCLKRLSVAISKGIFAVYK